MYAIYNLQSTLIQDGFYYETDAADWAAENNIEYGSFTIKRVSFDF